MKVLVSKRLFTRALLMAAVVPLHDRRLVMLGRRWFSNARLGRQVVCCGLVGEWYAEVESVIDCDGEARFACPDQHDGPGTAWMREKMVMRSCSMLWRWIS